MVWAKLSSVKKAVKKNQRQTDQQICSIMKTCKSSGQSRPRKFIQSNQYSDKPLYRDIFTSASARLKTP